MKNSVYRSKTDTNFVVEFSGFQYNKNEKLYQNNKMVKISETFLNFWSLLERFGTLSIVGIRIVMENGSLDMSVK